MFSVLLAVVVLCSVRYRKLFLALSSVLQFVFGGQFKAVGFSFEQKLPIIISFFLCCWLSPNLIFETRWVPCHILHPLLVFSLYWLKIEIKVFQCAASQHILNTLIILFERQFFLVLVPIIINFQYISFLQQVQIIDQTTIPKSHQG